MTARLPQHPEEDRLLELAYGEAPAAEARVIQQHVEGCARCREILQGIAEVRSAVRAVPPEPAPERGLESLLAYGERAAARARVRRRSFRFLGLLSVATAVGLVWVLLPAGPRERFPAEDTLARADAPAPARQESPIPETKATGPAEQEENERAGQAPSTPQRRKEAPKVAAAEPRPPAVATSAPAEKDEQAQGGREKSPPLDHAEAKKQVVQSPQLPRSTSSVAAAENAQKTQTAAEGAVDKKQSMGGAGLASSAPSASPEKAIAGPVATADSAADLRSAAHMGTAASPAPAAESLRPADRPPKAARLDQVRREVAQATGDRRKALLLEQCRLEAELLMGPAAVQTCSQVAREFPGTPEAKQATDLASGFSVQPAPR
jgi:anti-sigma factor ChrR (cupin superfamily)